MDEFSRREILRTSAAALAGTAGCSRPQKETYGVINESYQEVATRPSNFTSDNSDSFDTHRVKINEQVQLVFESNDDVILEEGRTLLSGADYNERKVHVFDGQPTSYDECINGIDMFKERGGQFPENALSDGCEGQVAEVEGYVVREFKRTDEWYVQDGYGFYITDWTLPD